MKVIILCGGKGLRLGKGELPKALFLVGKKPILWHIMRLYAHYGYKDFVLCLGFKGGKIQDFFSNTNDFKITFVDTGLDTNTGARIKRIKNYVEKDECFFATYGDGLSDVNLTNLLYFHKTHKKIATLTAVKPRSPFGIMGVETHTNCVTHFEEKPVLDHWINGGFFVFNREIFNYLKDDDVLEKETFGRLVKDKNLSAYKHSGFWECMDTYKDNLRLNELWRSNKAPWKVWKGKK